MAEQYGRFVYDDSLRPGTAEEGGWSHLLFNPDGKLTDHAVFIPEDDSKDEGEPTGADADEPSADEMAQRIAAAVGAGIAVVATTMVTAPHVKRWWAETITPRLSKFSGRKSRRNVSDPLELAADPAVFSRAVDEAVAQRGPGEVMSSAEAEQRLLAILAAAAFIADQIRDLKNARIDSDMAELGRAMDKLTTQQVTDSINMMLARDSSLLDEGTSNEFLRIFGGGAEVDGQFMPIRNDRVKQALRLTQNEPHDDSGGPRPFISV